MACSLDDLLTFCLDEVAISGDHGLHPTDLGRIVEAFYASYNRTRNDDNLNSSTGAPGRRKPPRVDRAFLEHVWKWLVRDPDIFVGRNREGNSLSFSEVEKRNSTHDERQHQKFAKVNEQAEIAYRSSGPSSLVPDDSISAPGEMRNQLRLFATEERMWLAVCGHPRDLTKVFDTEFALLSIIASKRSNGILQGDLVRLSRQDKRSVPKRTDSLRDKGYIEKRPVLAKGARTSILTLKKFAVQEKVFLSRGGNGANSDAIAFIDQDLLIRRAFDALRRMKLMTRDDLKETLGLTTRSQWKLLSRIIRKFEAWGFLKRVHAASAMSSKVQQHYSCVKYLKDVTDEDIKRYTSIGHLPANSMDLDAEGEDDDDFLPGSTEEPAPNAGPLQELGRIYPIWSPDRILSNLVFQVVDSMGTKGITLTELKNHLAGPRYSRPLEVFVGRIVENWASSQPHHLRHLSIIRDTAVDKKIAYFRHYSFRNFTELVERGGAYWEGVVFTGKKDKKYHETISSFLSSPATDSFGFPVSMRPTGQYKEGNASMGELMKGFDPGIWVQSTRDPVAYEVDGQDKIRYGQPHLQKKTTARQSDFRSTPFKSRRSKDIASQEPEERIRSQDSATGEETPGKPCVGGRRPFREGFKPTGRPRKYERGMEKFWRLMAQKLLKSRGLEVKGKGAMRHPLVTQMIQDRPDGFDEVYLQAVQCNAPIPVHPSDITTEWVEKTRFFLDREEVRAYVSPLISVAKETSMTQRFRQVVVIRSGRLQECSFSDLRKVSSRYTPRVQFFSSSRAHSLRIPQTIPPSPLGPPLTWLMPTNSGTLPQPPKPSSTAAPRYFPSIAAHTMAYYGTLTTAPIEHPSARKVRKSTSNRQSMGSKSVRKPMLKKPEPSPGPVLGIFNPGLFSSSRDKKAVSVSQGQPPKMPPPTHRTDGILNPSPKEAGKSREDLDAREIHSMPTQTDTTNRRSLRTSITPSAKQRESLLQSHNLYQKSRHAAHASRVGGGNEALRYLNAPSPGLTTRSGRLCSTKVRLLTSTPSTLVAGALSVKSAARSPRSLAVEHQNDPTTGDCLEVVVDSPVLQAPTANQGFVMSDAGDQGSNLSTRPSSLHGDMSQPSKSMTPDVQGRNSVGALHDDDATDSDKTVDLGPEKFVYSAQKRKTMVPVEPVTPKRQKRTAPPAANNTTNGESSDSHKVSVSAPETQGMPSKLDAAGSRNRESVDPGGPNGRSSHQQDEESSLEHAGEDVPKVTRQRSQDLGYQPRKRRRLDVWEGSIGFLRRKIISDILEKCNGVMPFGFPLWQTFATAWQRTGRATRPDARTLKTAVKGLVDSGQMKQLKFSFKDKNGLMHTQSMLVRPNIKVGDDVVRQMQKKIIEAFPRSYRPEQFEIDSSFRVRDTRPPTGQHHPYETVHDELVQTSRTYVKARNAERVRQNQELRERIANNLLPQRRPIVANQPRVSRLERIGGPHRLVKTKQDARLEFLLPSAQTITFGTLDSNPSEGSPDDRQGLIPQQLPDPKSEASMARELLNDRKQKELPHSLADVPDRRRKKIDHLNTGDPAYSKFQWDLDKVEKWEARKQSLFDDEAPETWQFINHKLTGPHDTVAIEGPLKFGAWSCFNESGVETIYSEPLEAGKSMQPSSALLISERGAHRSKRGRKPHQSQVETIPDKETEVRGSMPAPGRRAKYGPIQRKFIGTNQDVRQPTKQRRVEQLETIKFDPRVLFPDAKKLSRGPQVLKQLPEEMIHKLLITFVVMRVLVGGVEKLIDFSLVNMVFPDETEQFLKDRWRTMRNKYRHLMRRYTEDFQDHYLRAYENDEVPAIDYDDLPGNDWDAIVEWAMTVMEKPMQHDVEDLPDSRKDLDYSRQLIVETSNRPLREIYAYNTNATIPHREYVIAATPFAIPVVEAKGISKDLPSDLISPEVSQPVKQAPNELHAVARSWVLATVLTPDEQYSGIAATSKISQLPNYNNLVEVSIKSLVSSRIISHAGAGSKVTLSNRAYDISEHFMNTISRKRLINHEMLRRAMWYKINVLDPAFSVSSNRIKFDVDLVEEGDMVAVLNLAASGRIVIRPSRSQKKGEKVPANRYGLTNSYQTRFIEKDLFKFAVEIEPVGDRSWISGNPLLSPQGTSPIRLKVHAKESLVDRYPVPRGGMDLPPPLPGSTVADATDPNFNSTSAIPQQQAPPSPSPSTSTTVTPGRIPLYFTIHSTFIPSIWTMLISATVGLIAIRPGISTVEIARMLSPAIALEDLRMVLQWLKGVGAIKGGEEENRMGIRGWETCEWWWCVCE